MAPTPHPPDLRGRRGPVRLWQVRAPLLAPHKGLHSQRPLQGVLTPHSLRLGLHGPHSVGGRPGVALTHRPFTCSWGYWSRTLPQSWAQKVGLRPQSPHPPTAPISGWVFTSKGQPGPTWDTVGFVRRWWQLAGLPAKGPVQPRLTVWEPRRGCHHPRFPQTCPTPRPAGGLDSALPAPRPPWRVPGSTEATGRTSTGSWGAGLTEGLPPAQACPSPGPSLIPEGQHTVTHWEGAFTPIC